MRNKASNERIIKATEDAVRWLNHVKLTGIRLERVSAPVEEFERHRADFDVVVVPDDRAPPIWARHYEVGTDRPIFAGRDAVKRYNFSEVERERRTGTSFYGEWPRRLLDTEYPQWHKNLASAAAHEKS
jgi:PelA/Pel-15E family pectate lyase